VCIPSIAVVSVLDRYRQLEAEHPGHVVLMQVGDFYEIYGGTVEPVARMLDIASTRAPQRKETAEQGGGAVAMTGFPVRSLESFLGRLLKAGKPVVLADQVPARHPQSAAKFDRQVTRIITPGTVVEESLLEGRLNSFVCFLAMKRAAAPGAAAAWIDVSTGDFMCAEADAEEEMVALLARLRPRETIYCARSSSDLEGVLNAVGRLGLLHRPVDTTEWQLPPQIPQQPGHVFSPSELAAASALLGFLQYTRLSIDVIKALEPFSSAASHLRMDAATFRSLDILRPATHDPVQASSANDASPPASLFAAMNECKTALGSRLLTKRLRKQTRNMPVLIHIVEAPMVAVKEIERSLDAVEDMVRLGMDALIPLRRVLDDVGDIERLLQRLLQRRSQGVARDLRALARSLLSAQEALRLAEAASASEAQPQRYFDADLARKLADGAVFAERLPLKDAEGGLFVSGYDGELDALRGRQNSAETIAALEGAYRQQLNVPVLRVVELRLRDQFVIEVPKSFSERLREAQALRPLMETENKARFVTDELARLSLELRMAGEKAADREVALLGALVEAMLTPWAEDIRGLALRIAELDLHAAFAYSALSFNYCRPLVIQTKEPFLQIRNGRHPVLDRLFTDRSLIPNDVLLGTLDKACTDTDTDTNANTDTNASANAHANAHAHAHAHAHVNANTGTKTLASTTTNTSTLTDTTIPRFVLVTGPNMGGKSTYLRMTALLTIMAQIGSFVPATSAVLSPVDAIFTRIGASDDLARDRSTFMLEMAEMAAILHSASEHSLVLVDELGRGTAANEGEAIAHAVALDLIQHIQCRTLFATHYHSLARPLQCLAPSVGFSQSQAQWDGKQLLVLPKIGPGVASNSFALPVASMAGIPERVIHRAEQLLSRE
jgi:DNA mismatch repair protein MutS